MYFRVIAFAPCAFFLASAASAATFTPGNDFENFNDGVQEFVDTSFISSTGFTISVQGTFNVNKTVQDGLGGNDFLNMTSLDDYFPLGTVSNIEFFIGGDGDDVMDLSDQTMDITNLGGAGGDTISSGSGNDLTNSSIGDDWIDPGAGNDISQGAAGNDTIVFSRGFDLIEGNDDFDTVLFLESTKIADVSFGLATTSSVLGDASWYNGTELLPFMEVSNASGLFGRHVINSVEQVQIGNATYSTFLDADGYVTGINAPLPTAVPLPAGLPLLAVGLMGLAGMRARQNRTKTKTST